MTRKILIASIGLVIILAVGGGVCNPSFAWLRDANISESSDSIGLGWYDGFSLMAEKKIDDGTSFGVFWLPKVNFYLNPLNFYEASYNKQLIGNKNEGFAFSFYAGAISFGNDFMGSSKIGQVIYPNIGTAFRWKISDTWLFKIYTVICIPLFEFGYKVDKNIELAGGISWPFQLISLRYIF